LSKSGTGSSEELAEANRFTTSEKLSSLLCAEHEQA